MQFTSMELSNAIWLGTGLFAQALFSCRFIVQWISSERAKNSIIPVSFWYLSIGGSSLLLLYAIHRMDPVFILGQAGGLFIYVRNLMLLRRKARATDVPLQAG